MNRVLTLALVALLALSSSAFCQSGQKKVKAAKVRSVIYLLKDGKVGGHISYSGKRVWHEDNDDGRFAFKEMGRDEWSVYLLKTDGAVIQLDLYQRKFFIYDGPLTKEQLRNLPVKSRRFLYTVAKAYH